MTHNAVTTTFAGNAGTTTIHFHCPCGVDRRDLIVGNDIHPVSRFTSAIRSLHRRGIWPPAPSDLGDAEASGWGPARDETAA